MKVTPLTFPSFCDIFYCRKRSPKTKDEPFAFVGPPLPENKVVTADIIGAVPKPIKTPNDTLDSMSSSSSASQGAVTTAAAAVVKDTDNKIPKVELQNPIIVQSTQHLPHPPPPPITIVNKDDFQFAEPQTVRTVR